MTLRSVSLAFAAGAAAALVACLALWAAGAYGLTRAVGVALHPGLSPAWLYPRIVWGGLLGFLLLLPIAPGRPFLQGLVIGLGPSLLALLYYFPLHTHWGFGGLGLGTLTPLVVLLAGAVWGLTAVYWIRNTGR